MYVYSFLLSCLALIIIIQFSLPPDPRMWGSDLAPDQTEPDDVVHNPTFKDGRYIEDPNFAVSRRGLANIGCLGLLLIGLLALLYVATDLHCYLSDVLQHRISSHHICPPCKPGPDRFQSWGYQWQWSGRYSIFQPSIFSVLQIPDIGNFGLIDHDTPQEAYKIQDWRNGKTWQLVFSDEFNTDGRTFYPGDDPFWEAVDLHYWVCWPLITKLFIDTPSRLRITSSGMTRLLSQPRVALWLLLFPRKRPTTSTTREA